MQTAFSLPQNEDFYQRYATLAPVLKKLGLFAQVINGLTEFGIIHALIFAHISIYFGFWSTPLAVCAAAFGVFILEIGQRTFLPYAARAVLNKHYRGLDGWMTGFIFLVTLCLFGASLYLSFKGSKDLVEAVAPPPVLLDAKAADNHLETAKIEAQRIFKSDSTETAARYSGLATTAKNAIAAQITNHRATIQRIEAKERKAGQRYDSEKNNEKAKILALESELAARLAELEQQKAAELQDAKTRHRAALDVAATHRENITQKNEAATLESKAKVKGYGSGLGWFTVVFHLVLLFSFIIDEMHKKGSGVSLRAMPNQYHFSESIGAKFFNTLSDKWNYHTRNRIEQWAALTPAPPRPTMPPTLYELANWKSRRVSVSGTDDSSDGGQQQTNPVKPVMPPAPNIATPAAPVTFMPKHNGKTYHNGHPPAPFAPELL